MHRHVRNNSRQVALRGQEGHVRSSFEEGILVPAECVPAVYVSACAGCCQLHGGACALPDRYAGEWLRTWEKRYFYVFAAPSPRLVYSVSVRALSSSKRRREDTRQGVHIYNAPLVITAYVMK